MSTPEQDTEAPALAFDEGSMRSFFEKENPEMAAIEPTEGGEAPAAKQPAVTEETPAVLEEGSLDAPLAETPEGMPTEQELAEQAKKSEEAAEAAKAAAAAEAAKKASTPAAPVHQDLEDIEKNLDKHTKPSTRKVISTFKSEAVAARERANKAEQERVAAIKERDALQEQIKSGKPPEAMEKELTTLRERIRELDVSKDPAIESKYDKPVQANTDKAIEMLGDYGLFKVAVVGGDGKPTGDYRDMSEKEKALVTTQIKNNGVGLRTMAQHINRLEKSGDLEGAEQLRDLARENDRLAREKQVEITSIKGNYEGRVQARTKEQQAQQEQISTIARTTSEKTLQSDIAELAKSFPEIAIPPEPLATDSAAVVAAKKAAIAQYSAAANQVAEVVKAFNASGLTPDKAAEAQGRMTASAVKAVILQQHVLPRMVKQVAEKDARIKELEAQVAKFRTAGGLNRAHAASASAGTQQTPAIPATATFADSLREGLKARGVDVNT